MTAVAKLPDAIRALAEVIRKYGTCAPAALDHVADELTAALSPAELGGRKCRFCGCAEAPGTAPDPYTTDGTVEVCPQCNEGESYITAPQPAQAGASGGGDEHPYRQLQKWWEDGEPIPTLTIPDWAIASAYRQAVSKIVGPYFRAPNALPWAADITVAADWAAQEWRKKHPDYALDPLALAEWIRIHHRCSEVKDWERLPPELLWIYESLQRLAKLESAALTTRPTPEARDAARYRWLRGEGFDRPASMWVINFATKIPVVHTDLDAAIDAALALPAQGEGNDAHP